MSCAVSPDGIAPACTISAGREVDPDRASTGHQHSSDRTCGHSSAPIVDLDVEKAPIHATTVAVEALPDIEHVAVLDDPRKWTSRRKVSVHDVLTSSNPIDNLCSQLLNLAIISITAIGKLLIQVFHCIPDLALSTHFGR